MNERKTKANELLERIEKRRKALKLSKRQVSLAAGSEYVIRDLERGTMPGTDKLSRIAAVLCTTMDELAGDKAAEDFPVSDARIAEVPLPFRSGAVDADLPVLGTALAHLLHFGDDGIYVEQMTVDHGDPIRYIQRPPRLGGAGKAYAVYIEGDSMYPRFKQGELAVVDPVKKAQIGDDVIVQLVGDHDEDGNGRVVCVMVKELVRRSGSFIELRQFNPDVVFRVDADKVASIHPIMPIGVLLGA